MTRLLLLFVLGLLIVDPLGWDGLSSLLWNRHVNAAEFPIVNGTPIDELIFDVNFVVLTGHPAAIERASLEQLRREVEIINTYFIGENGEHPFRFRFKSAYYARDLMNTGCNALLAMGDTREEIDSTRIKSYYDACKDERVRDPRAINFYIYDSYTDTIGYAAMTSHGYNHNNRPFVLLDWARLNHTLQSPEEHEMGHAFGLAHVCVEGATMQTSTNIMASISCGKGSGGRRNIGFNRKQVEVIQQHAWKILRRFTGAAQGQ